MRQPSPKWIAAVVSRFAHGRRDAVTQLGCQRESLNDLGFGWLYFALARAGEARRVLVQGTGRGFSAACLALAIEHRPGSMLTILDPGYREWLVDAETPDRGDGLWSDQEQVQRHFAPLGLSNIELIRERSDEGYARLRERDELFDIILIDGDHGYEQCLKDLRNAVTLLRPAGFILLHDAFCTEWPGVALAIDTLQQEDATLEKVALPLYPGLCILQKTRPIVTVRPIDSAENDQVNEWRQQAGITMRPLPDGDDPRPGQSSTDSRVGLFAIVCDGKLAGGFGIRPRTFCRAGVDDFLPTDGVPRSGFLRYGLVLRPEMRGQGVLEVLMREWARRFGAAGFYSITDYPHELQTIASIQDVGQCGAYRAYHIRQLDTVAKPAFSLARQVEYRLRNMRTARQLKQEVADLQHALAKKEREIANLQHALKRLQQPRFQRWTTPVRRAISLLR